MVAVCKSGIISCTAVQGHAMALPCLQRISYVWHMAVINDSDPDLMLVRYPSPLCLFVSIDRAFFKMQRKKGKMDRSPDT